MPLLSFSIPGQPSVQVTVTEVLNPSKGFTSLRFDLVLNESRAQADLRGIFFDVSDPALLAGLSVQGSDVTRSVLASDGVIDMGNGNNMTGAAAAAEGRFDAGVAFGTAGIGKDDIDSTSFVLSSATGDLDLDLIGGMRFGARLTSVGPTGARTDSLKLVGEAPLAPRPPVAQDDAATTDEDTAVQINLLGNDSDPDGDPLSIVTVGAAANGIVAVNPDRSVTYTPDADFFGTDTLTYTISDGGETDTATATVTVNAVNDPPVAGDDGETAGDRIVVESGDSVLTAILANDTDPDGALDPASVQITQQGTLGTGTVVSGQLGYTAGDLTAQSADGSAVDTIKYTVADNDGAVSNEASVLVHVIDPLAETAVNQANAASNNQLISLSLSTEDRTYNNESEVAVQIDFGALVQQDVNVSFVVDGSGSLNATEYATQVEAVQIVINELRAQFAGSGTDVEVQLVQFAGRSGEPVANATQAASFDLFSSALNSVATNSVLVPQMQDATNYEAAFDRALTFFATGQGATDENFLVFLSDGEPNTPVNNAGQQIGGSAASFYIDEVNLLKAVGVDISAIGFGSQVTLSTLSAIDNTGGAQVLPSANDIAGAITASPLFAADVIEFKLSVNGIDQGLTDADLTSQGDGDLRFDGDLIGLNTGAGAINTIVATATFDTDGDGVADETRTATTNVQGTDGSDIFNFV